MNHVIAYNNPVRPMGRDAAKRLAAEERQMQIESSSLASTLPSLKSSVEEDLVKTLQEKSKKKENDQKKSHWKKEKKFKFDGYLKMADLFYKNGNQAKGDEFTDKATALLNEMEMDEEIDELADDLSPTGKEPESPQRNLKEHSSFILWK